MKAKKPERWSGHELNAVVTVMLNPQRPIQLSKMVS
jgi:hypothetical protein